MEYSLDSIEENLYKNKVLLYNETLINYIDIFNQIKNINFSENLTFNIIDFQTLMDNERGYINIKDNILLKFHFLDSFNEELNEKIYDTSKIVNICKDYSLLKKEDKHFIKEGYTLVRYMQILATTSYEVLSSDLFSIMFSSIEDELKSKFWISLKTYISNFGELHNRL